MALLFAAGHPARLTRESPMLAIDTRSADTSAWAGVRPDQAPTTDPGRSAADLVGGQAAPLSVDTVLWNLSSPAERLALLADAQGQALAQAQPAPTGGDSCTVEVRYTPVALGASHAFVVTTDADSQTYFRGGPSEGGPSGGSSGQLGSASGGSSGGSSRSGTVDGSGSSNSSSPGSARGGPGDNNGPWGPIVTDYGAYRPGTIDWLPGAPSDHVATVRGNCDAIDRAMAGTADAIEAAQIPYNPLAANSNATARTIVEGAGLTAPDPSQWVPGWNTSLPIGR